MTWWRILLDSPAQLAIIGGVTAALVCVPVFWLGWYVRGWWISKRPDGPLLITIKILEEENTELKKRTFDAEEICRKVTGYADRVARTFKTFAEGG